MATTHFIEGIDHVQVAIPAGSEAIARQFYIDLLGLAELEKPENLKAKGGLWLTCGRHQIHLGIDTHFSPAKKAHPAILLRNISVYRTLLVSRGLKPRDEDPLPGAARFYLDDPFGNRLEFLEWLS